MEIFFMNFYMTHFFPSSIHLMVTIVIMYNKLVIMDNCSIHHVKETQTVVDDTGVVIHYLPPYSSDYNPIELGQE